MNAILQTLGPTWAARVSLLTLLVAIIGVLAIAGALTQ